MSEHDDPTGETGGTTMTDDDERPDTAGDERQQAPGGTAPGGAGGTRTADPPPRRLMRSRDDAQIAGVAGGIGRYFGVDPVIVRVAFVLLTLAGGGGLILYALCWALLPPDDGTQVAAREPVSFSDAPTWARVGLVVLGLFLVSTRIAGGGSTFWWGLLLIGAGVLLFREDQRRDAAAPETPEGRRDPVGPTSSRGHEAAGSTAAGVWESTEQRAPGDWDPGDWTSEGGSGWAAPPPPGPSYRPVAGRPPRSPRPHSILGRLTVAVAALAVGMVALLDRLGATELTATRGLALALLVVGAGCLVGAVAGNGRGLVGLGLLLLPLLLLSATLSVPVAGVGERDVRPATPAEIAEPVELGAGELVVDLRDLDTGADPVPVTARVGLGQLRVIVPEGAAIDVDARASAGEVLIRERTGTGIATLQEESGGRVLTRYRDAGAGAGDTSFELDLQVGLGQIVVDRTDLR